MRPRVNIEDVDSATGVSFIAGAGFFGFLGGPVAFGFIAKNMGLRISFVAMLGLSILGLIQVFLRRLKA